MLKDDYFLRGAGLPGRFKAEKVEFHWGPSNGSDGSEHSINGRRFPVEVTGKNRGLASGLTANDRCCSLARLLASRWFCGCANPSVALL